MKVNLFTSKYTEKNDARRNELVECMSINLESGMHVSFNEDDKRRFTYSMYFNWINHVSGPDDINIIANADIYFKPEDIEKMHVIGKNECYALTRYDVDDQENDKFLNRVDSQDCWIFRGPIKSVPDCNFYLGLPGCDNKIALLLREAGYLVTNPSLSIKSYHLHNSQVHYYTGNDRVEGPYLRLTPTSL